MEYLVYILFSPHSGHTYVGFTSDLINRMRSHNLYSKKGYTTRYRPWIVIHVEFFNSKYDALNKEAFFKTGIGRTMIREYIQLFLNPL